MSVSDEKYLALTTYRKDGTAVSTPVWIVDLGDGTIGFTTASSSWKVKRVANDPRVTLQPSDSRGRVRDGSVAVSGTAVASQADYERVFALVLAKYKLAARAIKAYGKLAKLLGKGSGIDTAMIVTLDEER